MSSYLGASPPTTTHASIDEANDRTASMGLPVGLLVGGSRLANLAGDPTPRLAPSVGGIFYTEGPMLTL